MREHLVSATVTSHGHGPSRPPLTAAKSSGHTVASSRVITDGALDARLTAAISLTACGFPSVFDASSSGLDARHARDDAAE